MEEVYIVGGGGVASEIIECLHLLSASCRVLGIFDDDTRLKRGNSYGLTFLGTLDEIFVLLRPGTRLVIGLADQAQREGLAASLLNNEYVLRSVVHPTASVSPIATMHDGCYIAAGVFIGPRVKIGRCCIINVGASIGHDATLGDYSQTCPGARVSGYSSLGRGAYMGSNATLPPGACLGDYAKLGANSFAPRGVPAGKIAIGVPAKLL